MTPILYSALPMASINDMLGHIGTTVSKWGNSGAVIFGWLCLIIGMISLGQAIMDLRKHQPSGMHWLVAILGLLLGGYFIGGKLDKFKDIGVNQGQSSINSALNGEG